MAAKKKIEQSTVARLVSLAKVAIVVRYLGLLQLSVEGDLSAQVQRLQSWLEARTAKAEPELDPFVQICACDGVGHAAFISCPFCGDTETDDGQTEAERRKRVGTEEQAIALLLSRWPAGFDRVVPAPPAAVVKTSPAEVATRKRTRSAAAAAAKVVESPVASAVEVAEAQAGWSEEQNAAVEKLTQGVVSVARAFQAVLDREPSEALSIAAILDEVVSGADSLDRMVVQAALQMLVESGRAVKVGAMYRSTKAMGVEPEEDADDDGARDGVEPEDGEGGDILTSQEMGLPPDSHVHIEEGPASGTVEELDRTITEIHRLHGSVAISLYDQGVLCHRLISSQLYLQRRDITGNPVYKTFAQFATAELWIGKAHAYQLAMISQKYTRVQIEDPKLGVRKLIVLLAIKDEPTRHAMADAARVSGVSAAAVQRSVEALKPAPEPEEEADDTDGDEAPPSSGKAQETAGKREATPSKGPAAKVTPREQRITAALVPGMLTIPMMQRKKGKGDPKPARKLEQDPWCRQELPNGVVVEYRVFTGPGGILQLAIETTRSSA